MEEGSTNQESPTEATINPGAQAEATAHPKVPTIDPKALERAIQHALKIYLPRLQSTGDARIEFYNKHERETGEHDKRFVERYNADADTALITASLLSAVASAFIIAIRTELQPDYTQLSYDVLWIMANSTGLQPPDKPKSDSPWTGPTPGIALSQRIFCTSLLVSLLAAFLAVFAKQWLGHYSQDNVHASLVDCRRNRQLKIDGMAAWGFKPVVECLPLMLQLAILLLSFAFYYYLFHTVNTIAWVAVFLVVFIHGFYIVFSIASSIHNDCPFHTPFSHVSRAAIRFIRNQKYPGRYWRSFLQFSRNRRRRMPRPGEPHPLTGVGRPGGNNENDQLATVGSPRPPHEPVDHDPDWEGYVLDSKCIAWMFEMSMDPDVILDIMKFIPEIIWHSGIQVTPLEKLYDTVLECFDHSSGSPVITSKFRNKAYLSAKALVHLGIQRKRMNGSDAHAFASISRRHTFIGSRHYGEDSDLEYTLGMIDRVFGAGNPTPMRWGEFSFTDPHHAWMARILFYRAWYTLAHGHLPDDISEFLRHSLRRDPLPPPPIVSDCLLIIGLVLGITVHIKDQYGMDKGQKIRSQIHGIYVKLVETFEDITSTAPKIDHALEALRLIAPLSGSDITMKSYDLFHVIMRAPVSSAYSEEKKWEASRLALHCAYKLDEVLPEVEDPKDILAFLTHHFQLAEKGEDHDEPIRNALRALAIASTPKSVEILKDFDPTQPSFVHGIRFAFHDIRSQEVRKAALLFLPLIADKWFNAPDPIMTSDEMESLCVDWASAIDEVGLSTPAVQKAVLAVLLEMMNSPHWCPHIVPEKWKLLEYLPSAVSDDSQALKRCLGSMELLKEISNIENPEAVTLWSTILWLKYGELVLEVREWLEASAKDGRREDVDKYLSVIELELEEAEKESVGHGRGISPTPDQNVIALKAKIDSLKGAKQFLESF